MKLTRRHTLWGAGAALTAAATHSRQRGLPRSAAAARSRGNTASELLVVVFLRGGCDGLNLVAPVDDPDYVAARPSDLRLGEGRSEGGLPLARGPADLDFRLHPAAPGLKELYDDQSLAIVHACGLPQGSRSHFQAQNQLELGGARGQGQGWLARGLALDGGTGSLPAVALGGALPLALLGATQAAAISDPEAFTLPLDPEYGAVLGQLQRGDSPVHRAGSQVLAAVQAMAAVTPALVRDLEAQESYSEDLAYELGRGLRTIATLAQQEVGLRVATLDYGDWDTHEYQGEQFGELVAGLSRCLHGFYGDMQRQGRPVTVLVMTEFGRRLRSNGSEGTDHGSGTVLLALGDQVQGGRIYGSWPGLDPEQLARRTDLAVTTNIHGVLQEYLAQRWQLQEVLPGVTPTTLGIFG